jgi:hypothetical protein
VDVDVELEVVAVDSKVGLALGDANVEGSAACVGAANVELRFAVVDLNDELLFCEANEERFELATGPPLAKVYLDPYSCKLRNDVIVATSINDKTRDLLDDDITL